MTESRDIYAALRPPHPTPPDELCDCPPGTPIKLMWSLSFNPIACLDCNLEVPPENVPVPEDAVTAVAYWCQIDAAIQHLELDSGPYEQWARDQLLDPQNRVVTEGREVQRLLNPIRRCYYWFFQPQSDGDFVPRTTCPICERTLTRYQGGIFSQLVCEHCSVVLVGER